MASSLKTLKKSLQANAGFSIEKAVKLRGKICTMPWQNRKRQIFISIFYKKAWQ